MGNRTLLTEPFDGFSDPEFDDERVSGPGDDPGEPADASKRPLPAWRRIEEYRELRELNRRVQDEIYEERTVPRTPGWDAT